MKRDDIISIILFIAVFCIYLVSGYGTVAPFRDSGDLAVAAFSLGIPHPPGYVLYILCGKIIEWCIPWGDIAFKINCMSVLCGALAVTLLYRILRCYTGTPAAVGGAVCFALIPALWRLSQVSEMYSFNVCIGAFILLWFLKQDNLPVSLYGGALLCGLGLANHQTLMFFFPGYMLLLWQKFPGFKDVKNISSVMLAAAGFFLLGLSVHVFLPIRSFTEPVMDWGNPESIRNFLRVVSRADYGLFKLHPEESVLAWSFAGIIKQILFFGRILIDQFGWLGISAGLLGLGYSYRRKLFSVPVLLFIISGPFFVLLANLPIENATSLPILEPNLLMPGLIWSFWIGMGIQLMADMPFPFSKAGSMAVLICLLVSGVFGSFGRGISNRHNFLAYDYGKNILRSMEPGSILYNPDDPTTFITEYLKIAHAYRTDIRTFTYFRTLWGYHRLKKLYPEIMPEGNQDNAHEMLDLFFKKNIGSTPLYADLPFKFPAGYDTVPQGLVYRLKQHKTREYSTSLAENLLRLYPIRQYAGIHDPDAFFSRQVFSYYTAAENNLAVELLGKGSDAAAEQHYWKSLELDPLFKEGWSNLGALAFKRGNLDRAEKYFRAVIRIHNADMEGWYHVGLVLKKKGDIEKAERIFKTIPPQDKYGAYVLNELGLIYLSRNEYDKSIESFAEAVGLMPAYALPYYNLGLAYQRRKNYTRAVSAYTRYAAIISDPKEKLEIQRLVQQLQANVIVQENK